MSFGLSLEWEFCPDGVELQEIETVKSAVRRQALRQTAPSGLVPVALDTAHTGLHLVYRSSARASRTYEINLSRPLAADYVNATNNNLLLRFFSKHGLPSREEHIRGALEVDTALRWRSHMETIIDNIENQKVVAEQVNFAFQELSFVQVAPRLGLASDGLTIGLAANGLYSFMLMEVAFMAIGRVSTGRCANCGKAFVTGSSTGHNSRRKFCSDRCRVAHSRARRKEAMIAEAVAPDG